MRSILRHSKWFFLGYYTYIVFFLVFLVLPLLVACAFAFNDSLFPSLPWKGFTLAWFFGSHEPVIGVFHDADILESMKNSLLVAVTTTSLALFVGLTTSFLFERCEFRFKPFLYVLMLTPLVIPGVILGISILSFTSSIANWVEEMMGMELSVLRPSLFLVTLGQFSYIATMVTLIVSARLKKMDIAYEEAALNLGASRLQVFATITFPYLRPALVGAGILAFLMSIQDFNTTLMLTGSDAPLTVAMFNRLKDGTTPILNAVSLLIILGSALLGIMSIVLQRKGVNNV